MGGLLYGGGAGAVAGAVDFAGDFSFTGAGAGECLCAVAGDRAVVFAGAVAGARWRRGGGGEKTPVCPAGGGGGMDRAASVGVGRRAGVTKGDASATSEICSSFVSSAAASSSSSAGGV